MKIALVVAAALAVLIGLAFLFAPTREIRSEIRIEATPERVWSVLTDLEAYAEWNPFIVSARGEVAPGARLENTMRPQGGADMTFRPTVLVAAPEREFRWLGRLVLPRVFDGEHYFLLEADGTGTRLVHGEIFRGVALWFMDVNQFLPNFEAMNAALRARVAEAG